MLMNPLDMPGPQFLVFYVLMGVITLFFIRHRIAQQESAWPMPKLNLTDPYEIAFLRGGINEALRIAALSLIDRGLLEVSDNNLKTKNKAALDSTRRPIEKSILRKFSTSGHAQDMYTDQKLWNAAQYEYQSTLEQNKLIASDVIYASRRPMFIVGLFVIGATAVAKISFAVLRGHYNVMFLIILAVVFLVFLFKIYKKERTVLGDRVLADLRTLFKGLEDRGDRIKSGGETNEAALLAAIFGVAALSTTNFPYIQKLFPKAKATSSCSTTSCGSSCGSSCGGGGGGSGCGGCGGGD